MGVNKRSSKDIKRISVKEFREAGYLQEMNRTFLHPLGLAVEVVQESNGTEKLGGIWDYRDDPEGIEYGLKDSDADRISAFIERKDNIEKIKAERNSIREEKLGFIIEPID